MKKKKKLKNRIGALLCALVVAVSCLGASVPYYAYIYSELPNVLDVSNYPSSYSYHYQYMVDYNMEYIIFESYGYTFLLSSPSIYIDKGTLCSSGGYYNKNQTWLSYLDPASNLWTHYLHGTGGSTSSLVRLFLDSVGVLSEDEYNFFSDSDIVMIYSSRDLYDGDTIVYPKGEYIKPPSYNSNLGYLQNITRTYEYLRGAGTYYVNDNSRKDLWTFGQYTTTGIDLTQGGYSVRHYIKPCGVTGYEESDIQKEFDMYLMGEYDATNLRFDYLRTDYEDKLEAYGYEGLSFIEMYLKGWFVIEHHYLQLVDSEGNVGGYVHLYPRNADDDSFGVELLGRTEDNEFNEDDSGYGETIFDSNVGYGTTYEEAEADSLEADLGDIDGVDELANVLTTYGQGASQFSYALGQFLDAFPSWVVVGLGISMSLIVLCIVIKVIRG